MAGISRLSKAALIAAVIAIIAVGLWSLSPLLSPGTTTTTTTTSTTTTQQTDVTVLLSGLLQQVDAVHTGSGTVQLVQSSTGSQSVRFIDVTYTNGPDLYVYLSKQNSFSDSSDGPGEFVNLGAAPTSPGTFSKAIPDHIIGPDYASVLIWCREYAVLFTYAILE